jgi:hypothetical protein
MRERNVKKHTRTTATGNDGPELSALQVPGHTKTADFYTSRNR